MSSPIDTSGDVPTLEIGALVTSLLGIISFGWLFGAINFIERIGSGINAWLRGGEETLSRIVTLLFRAATEPSTAAWSSTAESIATIGLFGQVIALLELAVFFWILLAVLSAAYSAIVGVF